MSTSSSLHFSQKFDYGMRLLAFLAKHQETPQSIKTISETENISFSFLQKIANDLQKAKIITSSRGKYGGYKLADTPANLPLTKIIEALEGPISILPCMHSACDRQGTCEVKPHMNKINQDLNNYFSTQTLNNFI